MTEAPGPRPGRRERAYIEAGRRNDVHEINMDVELDVAYSSPDEFGAIVLDWLIGGRSSSRATSVMKSWQDRR